MLISTFGNYLEFLTGTGVYIVYTINRIFVIAIVTKLFTFMLKYLPDGDHFDVTSTYGAAGSLIVLLLWIYIRVLLYTSEEHLQKCMRTCMEEKLFLRPMPLFWKLKNLHRINPERIQLLNKQKSHDT